MTWTDVGAHEASKDPTSEPSSTTRWYRGAKEPTYSNSESAIMEMIKMRLRWWKSTLTSKIYKISSMNKRWSNRTCSARTPFCSIPRQTAHTKFKHHQWCSKCLGLKILSCKAPVTVSHLCHWIIKIRTRSSASSRTWSDSAMKLPKTSSFGRLKSFISLVSPMRLWKRSMNLRERTYKDNSSHRKMALWTTPNIAARAMSTLNLRLCYSQIQMRLKKISQVATLDRPRILKKFSPYSVILIIQMLSGLHQHPVTKVLTLPTWTLNSPKILRINFMKS